MRLVTPQPINSDNLDSTTVINEVADWTAGTYTTGTQRVYENRVYEVVADPSTDDQPAGVAGQGVNADPPTWTLMGWSNQYRMFTEGVDSVSTAEGNITVTFTMDNIISTVACLGLQGNEVTITCTDSTDGVVFTETQSIVDIGVSSHWEWHFLSYDVVDAIVFDGIPPYTGLSVEISIDGELTDPISCGRVVAGTERTIGAMQYDTTVENIDYSIKERDGFGKLTLVPRRTVKRVEFDLWTNTSQASLVQKELRKVSAMPTLYIGTESQTATIIFGVYRDFSISLSSPTVSYMTLEVEEF